MENKIYTKELLTKLGASIYLHKQLIKTAQKGKEAIDYLAKKGIFNLPLKRTKIN